MILPGEHGSRPAAQFTVTNTGTQTGTEVAQVYTGQLPTSTPTPLKEFAGSARVTLRPGQSKRVTVAIDPLSLSFWDVTTHAWTMPAGQVPILVGSSSRTILLQGTLQVDS